MLTTWKITVKLFTAFQTQHISASLPYFLDQSQKLVLLAMFVSCQRHDLMLTSEICVLLLQLPPLDWGFGCARVRGGMLSQPPPNPPSATPALLLGPNNNPPKKLLTGWVSLHCADSICLHLYVHMLKKIFQHVYSEKN